MAYTITARVYQTNTNAFFNVVERTPMCSLWAAAGRDGENFIVTLGVHNYLRWGDIVTNLTNEETGAVITPQYYSDGHPDREHQREAQLVAYNVANVGGRDFAFNYVVAEGNNLRVNIVIG
ncbi:Cytolysin/lectin [Lactifluus subvellereus]|nr:Cytolysin/lectin [Lactifluus subvellereus]